jgi:osmotically-inducible protein OsmY
LLKWNAELPAEAIQVKVAKGWISLSGEVEWQYQRQAAEDNVRSLVGVTGVSNLISVAPRAVTADVTHGIEAALRRDAHLQAEQIKVVAKAGAVTLEGRVRSWRERDAIERAAWAAPGVESVDNHLVIG